MALDLSSSDPMAEVFENPGHLEPAEAVLARLAVDLGATWTGGPLSVAERALITVAREVSPTSEAEQLLVAAAIRAGEDPLGATLIRTRSRVERRPMGAFYTPAEIVDPMLAWALRLGPARLVDAGCGSGRFVAAAVRREPDLRVIAVDLDPMATLLTRATLAVLHARDPVVIQADYTRLDLPALEGHTAWVSNPPYVRHHDLSPAAKAWASATGKRLGVRVSGLSGLHMHFFLATAIYARPGDVGCFVTSSEWLDVGYGSAVRRLLLDGLGGVGLDVLEPTAVPFEEVATTAVVVAFEVGATSKPLRLRRVADLAALDEVAKGAPVDRRQLHEAGRWMRLAAGRPC